MAKTGAERMRDTRARRARGESPIFKHENVTERVRRYRVKGGEELRTREKMLNITRKKIVKEVVLSHYGNGACACVKCGESRIECLSIDHIKGGGNRHRNTINKQGASLYTWLVKNSFPLGYQTLCMNCQWVKRFAQKEYNHLINLVTTVTTVTTVA